MREVDRLRQSYERLVGKYNCEELIKSAQEGRYEIESFRARRIQERCNLIIDGILLVLKDRLKNRLSNDVIKIIKNNLKLVLAREFDRFYISNKDDWTYRILDISNVQYSPDIQIRLLLEADYVTFLLYEGVFNHNTLNIRYRINPTPKKLEHGYSEDALEDAMASYIFDPFRYIGMYLAPIEYAMTEKASFVLSIEREQWNCKIDKCIGEPLRLDIETIDDDVNFFSYSNTMNIKRISHVIFYLKRRTR